MQKELGVRGFFLLCLSVAGMALVLPSPAQALQKPKAIATDSRIRTVRYSPNEVFKFTGHYGYQSSVEFAADEEVQTVSLGDSIAWMVNPSGNRLFIKPIEQNATTNMTVITDKRTYYFELHASETSDIRDEEMVFALRFTYPESDFAALQGGEMADGIPDFNENPEKYNFNYTLRGAEVVAPIRIFDDGQFTYFEFKDINGTLPAFFRVDSSGNEELINFRKRGGYVVVEQVTSRFTLRRGPDIVCVYNEALPMAINPAVPKGWWERNFGG